jgi:hypothetical protein
MLPIVVLKKTFATETEKKNQVALVALQCPIYRVDHKVVRLGANKKTFFVIARFSKI